MKLDIATQHPREQITRIIRRIYKAGLTTTTGGNISYREENGDIWVTPSGIDKGSLEQKDIICVRKDGTIEGLHKPSSEFTFHKAIYEARPDIRAVIHAHAPALVSFSMVRKVPDTNVIPLARNICGPVGYAKYAISGGAKLGEVIAAEFSKGFKAVIMENHGVVLGGVDLKDVYVRFETLEFAARTIFNARSIGAPIFLKNEELDAMESQIPADLPEMESEEHPFDELAIRESISDLVRRACDQGLMIGSYGTVSVRWKKDDFLITPRNIPMWEMASEDVVQIREGKREAGKLPSRALQLHARIYKENPQVNSIIMAQPPHVMAFVVSDAELNVRIIPESLFFLRDIPKVDLGKQFDQVGTIASMFSPRNPAIIIRNDSIIVTGDKLMQTFDRLEIAEFTARSLIIGKTLGEWVPMTQEQIDELIDKFG
jgi:L-fuculose-phosphate aldolase